MMYTLGNKEQEKALRKRLPPLDLKREDPKALKELVRRMRQAMKEVNGIGLSANQIGVAKRIFIAQVPDAQGHTKFYAVMNPEIVKTSKETVVSEEGCLSVPGRYGFIERPDRITLQGYDARGKKVKIKAWGLLARVFQHEVDHLNGVLFSDKCTEVREAPRNL